MKKVIITNVANENVEITANDWGTFLDTICCDNCRELCEVFDASAKITWVNLAELLGEIEGKKVDLYGEDFEDALENLFDNHLFANEIHG